MKPAIGTPIRPAPIQPILGSEVTVCLSPAMICYPTKVLSFKGREGADGCTVVIRDSWITGPIPPPHLPLEGGGIFWKHISPHAAHKIIPSPSRGAQGGDGAPLSKHHA